MIYSLGPFCALVRLSHLYDRPIVQTTGLFCTQARTEHTHTHTNHVCVCVRMPSPFGSSQPDARCCNIATLARTRTAHAYAPFFGRPWYSRIIHPSPLRCACACCRCNATMRNNGNERHEWSVWRKSVVRLMTPEVAAASSQRSRCPITEYYELVSPSNRFFKCYGFS